MCKLFCLVLLTAAVAAQADRNNINDLLDRILEQFNYHQRQGRATLSHIPEIPLSSGVKFSDARLLGIDSIWRTADCWQEIQGSDVSYDIHYGFQLLAVILPHLEVQGKNMSAFANIGDNSMHLAFTMRLGHEKCNVTLEELLVEKMEEVDFGASRAEYNRLQLDGYFKMVVIPALNSIVDSHFDKIEAFLQILCRLKDYQDKEDLQDVTSLFHQ